jgi:hypothetical protein
VDSSNLSDAAPLSSFALSAFTASEVGAVEYAIEAWSRDAMKTSRRWAPASTLSANTTAAVSRRREGRGIGRDTLEGYDGTLGTASASGEI